MAVSDKAVSTEDLGLSAGNARPDVAKLEGAKLLNTLLESKVESIKKNDRSSSLHSSPKLPIGRSRITSTSTSSSKDKDDGRSRKRYGRKRRNSDEVGLAKQRKTGGNGGSRQRISSSSPDSPDRYNLGRCREKSFRHRDEEANFLFEGCPVEREHRCRCRRENNDAQLHFEEDYVSLRIEDCDEEESEASRRARRKRRKRRKRRAKRHLAMAASAPIEPHHVKVLEADELPQRARWTIVATACLLLFMCLLLVGVTLRMAPIIDDMVSEMSACGADSDVAFIVETESPKIHSFGNGLRPSPSRSRSPSYRDDRTPSVSYGASSLDVRRCSSVASFHSYQQHTRNSSRRSRRSQTSEERRRRSSSFEDGRKRSPGSDYGRRRSRSFEDGRRRKPRRSLASSAEERAKERRRRRIVYVVVGTFLFLLFASVLAVVVTLTHRSEFSHENETTVYYTFAPHPKVVHGDFLSSLHVRRENEELINSINREPRGGSSGSNVSSPE